MNLLELVPREKETFQTDALALLGQYPQISGINIPDVLRLEHRSYEAAAGLLDQRILAIPHIRAIDHPVEKTLQIIGDLIQKGLTHVLIVSGDAPDLSHITYEVTTLEVISGTKEKYPNLKIYGALDPYRQAMKDEIFYCKQKLKAGAKGFFSQPFFDLDLASIFLEQLSQSELFLGISPVTSESSKSYWINRNKAVFPPDFGLSLDENIKVSRELMKLAERFNQHTYHMPIKVDPDTYLNAVFKV